MSTKSQEELDQEFADVRRAERIKKRDEKRAQKKLKKDKSKSEIIPFDPAKSIFTQ